MPSVDGLITRTGPVPAPLDYVVPVASDIQPLAITASFDGTSAVGSYVPCLEIIAQSGAVVAYCPLDTTVAAGVSADVSWFPWRRGIATSVTPPPNPLGTIFAWYDFADTSTITLDGSGKIQAIADKSGNSHDLGQSTAAQRPSETTVNGHNAGLFAAASNTGLVGGPWGDSLPVPFTILGVFTLDVAPGAGFFPGPWAGTNQPNEVVMFESNGNTVLALVAGSTAITTPIIGPYTQQQVTCLINGASSSLRLNGAAANGTITTPTLTHIGLGASRQPSLPGENDFLTGKICEVLFYQTALSSSQLSGAEAYLKSKWATP